MREETQVLAVEVVIEFRTVYRQSTGIIILNTLYLHISRLLAQGKFQVL